MRSGWIVWVSGVLVIVGGIGLLVGAAGGFDVLTGADADEVLCSQEPGPMIGEVFDGPEIIAEDRGRDGEDACDYPTDGSWSKVVIRGDDCVLVYPDGWRESDDPETTVAPFGVDGTCWYAIDED